MPTTDSGAAKRGRTPVVDLEWARIMKTMRESEAAREKWLNDLARRVDRIEPRLADIERALNLPRGGA